MTQFSRDVHVMRATILAAAAALLLISAPARAQQISVPAGLFDVQQRVTPPPPRPTTTRQPRVRAYFLLDRTSLAAAETFDAVIDKSVVSMPGAGGEVLRLWKNVFARVAFSSTRETGSRVSVFDGEVFSHDIPLTVELRPLEIAAGWRLRPLASGRIVPYAGTGLLRMGYRETSEFAVGDDNSNTTFSGTVVFGGIEAVLVSWIFAGVEVQHRSVPNALGEGGVSQVFRETDLGGTTVRVLFGIRR